MIIFIDKHKYDKLDSKTKQLINIQTSSGGHKLESIIGVSHSDYFDKSVSSIMLNSVEYSIDKSFGPMFVTNSGTDGYFMDSITHVFLVNSNMLN